MAESAREHGHSRPAGVDVGRRNKDPGYSRSEMVSGNCAAAGSVDTKIRCPTEPALKSRLFLANVTMPEVASLLPAEADTLLSGARKPPCTIFAVQRLELYR
jgi:hypothetical protein